ncbi:tRNA (adenosine(37)-N6)-threonylcarbamoyltransferase complex ATPase subunit type 1 TsaE [Thermodesulfobacteriota bacterium]
MISESPPLRFNIEIETRSPEETRQFGRKVGEQLNAGTVLALFGDLGSGKTVFVQGIASGLNVPSDYYVTSPSYTLVNEYPGRHPLFHVDLYRLDNVSNLEDIGLYDIIESDGIVAIEWAERLQIKLLSAYVAVYFEVSGDESRKIRLIGYGHESVDLLRGLQS